MTLAPELPGALPFINHLIQMDIIPAIGHTNATYEETMRAIAAGARYATHLFNAMRAWHHREPGATGALLLADNVIAELIADPHHLHPAAIELACKVKGPKNLLLVSDAIRACGMKDGQYELGGQSVKVVEGKAMLDANTLAGSTISLLQAIKNMVASEHCSLIEAIQMASSQPAAELGLSLQKGAIEVGFDADIVVLSSALEVRLTLCRGEVFRFKTADNKSFG